MPEAPLEVLPDERRHAALLAEGHLRLEAARGYGLITGGPDVDVERCEELIAEAKAAGITYSQDDVDHATAAVAVAYAGSGARSNDV
jgi:hypothetical protein